MSKWKKALFALAFIAVFAAAIGVVMLLWNLLIPSIIGWSAINYWQAAGLMILCRLLFSGFGKHGRGRHFWGRHHEHHEMHKELHERMKSMSRDERREFIRQRMRDHHHGPHCDCRHQDDSASNHPQHDEQ